MPQPDEVFRSPKTAPEQGAWTKATSPGQRIASEVIARVGGRVYGYSTAYNVTKWGRRGPVGNPKYNVSYFDNGYSVSSAKGANFKVRNPRWQWAKGNRGAMGSIVGAGLIDGFYQVISDVFINGLCLSPNQVFWRASVAIAFGLIAGTVGLAAGAAAAAVAGVTGITLTGIAFTASLITTIALFPAKQDGIDSVTEWSG